MGYTALLFCPDDKTARTVTQVLSELEFTVEACIEPFAAVKKLMGIHFDAVVVDCDNEQNATLLFKSARNSTSNQTSLAVAVVEGQAGVAKAFRIGANLVLTKPINIEQAKGTLRVARGLLRKSEPGKPTAPGTTPAAAPAPPPTPVAAKPVPPKAAPAAKAVAPKPTAPLANSPLPPRPVTTSVVKPATTQAWPAAATASSRAQDDDLPGIDAQDAKPGPAASPRIERTIPVPSPADTRPAASTASGFGAGAASAPAPAREYQPTPVAEKPAEQTVAVVEKPAHNERAAYVGGAPTFSFGGANVAPESSGANKKIVLGVVAAIVLVAVGVFAWTQIKSHSAATPAAVPAASTAVNSSEPKPSAQPAPPPEPVTSTSAPAAETSASTSNDTQPEPVETARSAAPKPSKSSGAASSANKPAPTEVETESAPAPMVVKGGKVPPKTDSGTAEAPAAPSMTGMAMPGAAPPADLVKTPTSDVRPLLQTLSISQGVSQGLLYKKVAPTYPQNAIRMRIEGAVELQATISKSGAITLIKVVSGDPQLAQAAMDAVKQWKYKPYLLNGEPVEIQTQITVNFKLPH